MSSMKQFIGAAMIAVSLFLIFYLDIPAYQRVNVLRAAIQQREAQFQNRQDTIQHIKDLNVQMQSKIGDLNKFSAVIPTKKQTAELISEVDQIARASGIQLAELSMSESKLVSKEDFLNMNVLIKINGSYNALLSFLDGLEKNVRILDVTDIEASQDINNPAILNIKISADAYFLK